MMFSCRFFGRRKKRRCKTKVNYVGETNALDVQISELKEKTASPSSIAKVELTVPFFDVSSCLRAFISGVSTEGMHISVRCDVFLFHRKKKH